MFAKQKKNSITATKIKRERERDEMEKKCKQTNKLLNGVTFLIPIDKRVLHVNAREIDQNNRNISSK